MREFTLFFAKDGPAQLTLRELRAHLLAPTTLAALAGVAVVLGISGPFGTLEVFGLGARMAYWAVVVPLTYGAGFLGTRMVQPYLPHGPRGLRMALTALGSAIAVALVLVLFNTSLGHNLGGLRDLGLGFAAVYVICFVIEAVGAVLQSQSAPDTTHLDTQPPALLARLPIEKRGALLALTAQDHYIHVITTKGREMLLMRLADAITEAAPTKGVQIHRSHWVALAGVASVARGGGEVTLTNGARLPIARTRLKDLRAQGLLPAKGN